MNERKTSTSLSWKWVVPKNIHTAHIHAGYLCLRPPIPLNFHPPGISVIFFQLGWVSPLKKEHQRKQQVFFWKWNNWYTVACSTEAQLVVSNNSPILEPPEKKTLISHPTPLGNCLLLDPLPSEFLLPSMVEVWIVSRTIHCWNLINFNCLYNNIGRFCQECQDIVHGLIHFLTVRYNSLFTQYWYESFTCNTIVLFLFTPYVCPIIVVGFIINPIFSILIFLFS